MRNVPIHTLSISDFRRLEGRRVLALDAPVVLIHGPNGAGKTSILSALELALTGDIRSMRRQTPRYTAHLPFHGQEFATVRVTVADELATRAEPSTMTVGGSRIEGAPALDSDAAQFYAERCYLDQVSLGQLLELYQYREGKEESALAKFVNELLGLEQLDDLRSGLSDAVDLRRLRKLSEALSVAEAEAKEANSELSRITFELEAAQEAIADAQERLAAILRTLRLPVPDVAGEAFAQQVQALLESRQVIDGPRTAVLHQSLTALGGRIGTLANLPSVRRLEDARAALDAASAAYEQWRAAYEPIVDSWRADAANFDPELAGLALEPVELYLRQLDLTMSVQEELVATTAQAGQQLQEDRTRLLELQVALSGAQEQAGSLVEGLAALRDHTAGNICPVCDRDFTEVASTHLSTHVDRKIAELTNHGARLRELRQQRDALADQVQRDEQALEQSRAQTWSERHRTAVQVRRAALNDLRDRLATLQPALLLGRDLHRQRDAAAAEVADAEALLGDVNAAGADLQELAQAMGAPPLERTHTLEEAWRELADFAATALDQRAARERAYEEARQLVVQFLDRSGTAAALKGTLAETAQRKVTWESRLQEARRRQGVAKAVHDASSTARTRIVQRVFTESLNDVWRSVFTRLAPREPFVPAFGIPSASRTALELSLETVHTSGEAGGSPQMMLSAGNLNTAALSLFIALHLAVEPLVRCLVFDDPVQSMDEVHVAQFAGLVRVLSKHHERQVIIAVHERELFQYLALELSPAFEGDELITIELGDRAADEDGGVQRHIWSPDPAIAV